MNDIDSEAAAIQWLYDISPKGDSYSIDKLKALIQRFPNAIRVQNEGGWLPLHFACLRGCSTEVIRFLLVSWPPSVKIAQGAKLLPLHYACRASSLTVIQSFVQAWPDSVRLRDGRGCLPLHHACQCGRTAEIVQFLLNCWPEAAQCWSNQYLPLHRACMSKLPLPAIQSLIEAWPDSISKRDRRGYLPLHCACECGCTHAVIQFLVQCWPMSLHIKSNDGTLPLHLALKPRLSLETIQLLVQTWPDAVREKDNRGFLPLHFACEFGCMTNVVQFLVRSWPESCQVPTKDGKLSLHLACGKRSSFLVSFILDCYPQAARIKDNMSQLPLHTACLQEVGLEVMRHLVRAWPDTIHIPCPFDYKVDYKQNTDESDDSQQTNTEQFVYDINGNEVEGNGGDDDRTNDGSRMEAVQCNALPLDLICAQKRQPSPQLIGLLTNQMPPLHFVCTYATKLWSPRTMVTMGYLMSKFPQDSTLFYNGMLPFHCACHSGATRPFLNWWWKKYPDIVQLITEDTRDTPLHCYLSSAYGQKQWFFLAVQFLVGKCSNALRTTNKMGMLPWHIAAIHQAPLDILFYLVRDDPEASGFRS